MGRETKLKRAMILWRELREVDEKIYNLGWETLPKPVQRGWTMRTCLRKDYLRRKDRKYWEGLLSIVWHSQYCSSQDFMYKPYGSKKKIKRIVGVKSISEEYYENILEEKYKKLFERRLVSTFLWGTYSRQSFKYVLMQSFMFTSEIVPRMITKVRIRDCDLESRQQELWNKIDANKYYPTISREIGERYKDDWDYESRVRQDNQEKRRFNSLVKKGEYDAI